jgi:hypothetical protein
MTSQRRGRLAAAIALLATTVTSAGACVYDRAPSGLRRTPDGPGATVRYDLSHTPLPDIPLPIDTATFADPTSRTGLRINASLIAPTNIERQARERFDRMEGWGTFAPISVAFDLADVGGRDRLPSEAAIDLANVRSRHQGDDFDFEDDAVYLVDLETGLPHPIDVGNGNFDYTLKRLDRYWANDTRQSERNLLFDTIDESGGGAIGPKLFGPEHDTDFDGHLDVPNLDEPYACPAPDLVSCDKPGSTGYDTPACVERRRGRDQCIADHLLTYYERETDSLVIRPLVPLHEMRRYAVILTDRLIDANGDAVKSPFDFVYHASQEATARRVGEAIDDPTRATYFGDLAGSGLAHVAFTWSFTTQPTVDDMKRLRDGLYGQGPFARWAAEFPPNLEIARAVGLDPRLGDPGIEEAPGWLESPEATTATCSAKADNLFIVHFDDIKESLSTILTQAFGESDGPDIALLLRSLEAIDYMMIAEYDAPFLLEGGPDSTDPNASFSLDWLSGVGEVATDRVQVWAMVPKATADHQQPFDVNIYGHGYTGAFLEEILYAGQMAEHGLATVGINAMGHQLVLEDAQDTIAKTLLGGACIAPFYKGLTSGRARDLNRDGVLDSGGDFWSSYVFHTRDGVRQSILDHLQLVRIMRSFGTSQGNALCRSDATGWDKVATERCDANADGAADTFGDFDGDGVVDFGGPASRYATWGESLGGILSGIHGAIDPYVTAAAPGSGGGGLTDIGIRSFQGGVIEAVLLRIWGPLVVAVPSTEREPCSAEVKEGCTACTGDQLSIRWVMPDVNGTGEMEMACVTRDQIRDTTVFVDNLSSGDTKCARVEVDQAAIQLDQPAMPRFRVGLPASIGDRVRLRFHDGADVVTDYESCEPTFEAGAKPRTEIATWGVGPYVAGGTNAAETEVCPATSKGCQQFQGLFVEQGAPLTAPAEGFGEIRQTPALRRFMQLAQTALEPGDPISFAPYYSILPMTDPYGAQIAPHAVVTMNTIGDMNVPLNSGIAFARATGALPFLRPDQVAKYPEWVDYATPEALFVSLGNKTPNQVLIDEHVIEGITKLARHPAGPECATSANWDDDKTFLTPDGEVRVCSPTGCNEDPDICLPGTACDEATDRCKHGVLGQPTCDEALFDADDLDEGKARYFEAASRVPVRAVRYTQKATPGTLDDVWAPRIFGAPYAGDGGWVPDAGRPLTGLIDAYVVPEGVHTWVNGNPCEAFDAGTYLTNLVARFFQTNGTDLYYLSHPTTHHCLETSGVACGYLTP